MTIFYIRLMQRMVILTSDYIYISDRSYQVFTARVTFRITNNKEQL